MKLNSEQQQFFAAMENTFRSPGWTMLANGWREDQKGLAEQMFFGAKNMEDVESARVRYRLLNELVQLPDVIAAQKTAILEDEGQDEDYV